MHRDWGWTAIESWSEIGRVIAQGLSAASGKGDVSNDGYILKD
jgi:hypothetical protein